MKVLYRYAVSGDLRSILRVFQQLHNDHPGYRTTVRALATILAGFVGRCGGEHLRLQVISWRARYVDVRT
jgi:hypothetical protein